MAYKDPRTKNAYSRRWCKENRARNLAREQARRHLRQEAVKSIKAQPCTDCGVQYPYYVMDFDHVRGEKHFNIAHAVSDAMSMDRILEEIAKCEVVCANCHRARTFQRKQKTLAP